MREWIKVVEGDVVPFPQPRTAAKPFSLLKDLEAENLPDFEVRYIPNPGSSDWKFGFQHSDDYRNSVRAMNYMLKRNPHADQGVEGMRYVEFVPMTDRARDWLAARQMDEKPRLFGKLAVIDLLHILSKAGLTTKRILVWD